MQQYVQNKKYPFSKSGIQCVGPCYKKNTKIIHPIYLNAVSNIGNSFCPIAETRDESMKPQIIDFCDDNLNTQTQDNFNINEFLYPYINFDGSNFLDSFYNLNDFGSVINWIDNNKNLPINTRFRIFDLGIKSYKNIIDIIEISDSRIIDFLIQVFKTKYLNNIVIELLKYITINDKLVEIKYTDKKETNESIIIKTNYINKNIINIENVSNFISYLFKSIIEEKEEKLVQDYIINKFISFLIGNIKKQL